MSSCCLSWSHVSMLFFLKAVLATLNLFNFCMDFRISLSVSIKNLNFGGDCIKLQINLERTDILILSRLLKHEHSIIFHFRTFFTLAMFSGFQCMNLSDQLPNL